MSENKNGFYSILNKIRNGWVLLTLIRSWFRRKDGATAIEFSLLFIPYLMISLGIVEVSMMFASASLLEGATDSASRLIRTGKIQQSNDDPETVFRDAMCSFAVVLINCQDVMVEVSVMQNYGDFSAASFDANGDMVTSGFDAGGSGDKILIRAAYRYNMVTPLVGPLLNGPGGSTLFVSTIVLQTEPYEFQGGA